MTLATAQQTIHDRCEALARSEATGDGHLMVAELATHGLWVGLHSGVVPGDEETVQPVLAEVLRLAGLDSSPAPLAAVVTGTTDPVVDRDRPILCASLEIMEKPGATTISLDDVARRAHVSLASLRSTFVDIHQLLADQIAFVADDAAVDALPPDLPAAQARVADQVSAFSSEPRATAILRLLTLSGLTRQAARQSVDAELYREIDALGSPTEVAPLRVALLALDALTLSGESCLAADAWHTLTALTEDHAG